MKTTLSKFTTALAVLAVVLALHPAAFAQRGGSKPPAPTGLVATAGQMQVALTWSASSGATSYRVKRSVVSGKNYVTIASPTATNHLDTNVTGGTKYYYVVTAVNAYGESAKSSQVSATPWSPPPPTSDPALAYLRGTYAQLNTNLWVMNSDGAAQVQLTSGFVVTNPVLSPDSQKIAFNANYLAPGGEGVYVINKDGTGLAKVPIDFGSYVPITVADWAPMPDGVERLAISANLDGIPVTYFVKMDGSGLTRVTPLTGAGDAENTPIGFSGDGSTVFCSEKSWTAGPDLRTQVVAYRYGMVDGVMTLLGSSIEWSDDTPTYQIGRMSMSRVANKIVFSAYALPIQSGSNEHLFVLDLVPMNPAPVQLTFGSSNESEPCWSADGTEVGYSLRTGTTSHEIWKIRLADVLKTRMTTYASNWPAWRRQP